MEQQLSFADSEYQHKRRQTRKEHFIFANAGYRGADKRSELQDVEVA